MERVRKCKLDYSCNICGLDRIDCLAYAQNKCIKLEELNKKHLLELKAYRDSGLSQQEIAEYVKAKAEGRVILLLDDQKEAMEALENYSKDDSEFDEEYS